MSTVDETPGALQSWGLSKQYDGSAPAVRDLSLFVPAGTLYGLVGPNGAGKTTFLSMATGIVRPSAGQVWIDGHDVWADPVAARGRVGLLPDGPSLPEALPGRRALHYVGVLHGLDPAVAHERCEELLAVLDIAEAGDRAVSTYSAGMKKKIGLAAAMIHSPRLLVLDEPLEAVDPMSARTIRHLLESFVARGGTAMVSSHSMPLIEQMCSHVAILARGSLLAANTIDDVRAGGTLEGALFDAVGGGDQAAELPWLGS
ncbi:ABC transporter ATP-binding protein [Rhodococcus sp. SORGH_AS_0303]|uniref:ABC transporter ATP-binding protein n=1 Tax=Rhodococcus sp. SORGH_AS_0303 TaxID=3041753 RepID=UPI002788803C|nr:ABC transporter ATP-binding protein [Rhodococcus sp. SORGH_AS_0303]MDQ1203248.1 ABC-2 type transport system ATP-binding protein [Rhodococcus sp. SORGH_AS_0303]